MKFASYRLGERDSYGIVVGDHIVDLGKDLAGSHPDLRSFLTLEESGAAGPPSGARVEFRDVIWRPVIPNPDKILCVGLNFREHIREVGKSIEEYPVIFMRLASSQVGHQQPMVRPKVSEKLDFEGELAVIIGRSGRYIPAAKALEHVAGYSIYNDGSVRDWQRHTHQYTPGKNFPSTGAFGPWMVSRDEIPNVSTLHLTTRLNGDVVQSSLLNDVVFSVEEVVSYVSNFTELVPGDVIITGTPSGVGAARKPPLWMKPGDRVEVEISSIGTLSNPVVQEL